MRTFVKFCAGSLLLSLALAGLMVGACLLWGTPFDHTVINIDGEPLALAKWHAGHVLAGIAGLAVGLLVVLVVVPVAVVVPVLIVAGVLVAVLAVLAGVAAVVFAPLFLVLALVWVIWRLARRSDKPAPGVAP